MTTIIVTLLLSWIHRKSKSSKIANPEIKPVPPPQTPETEKAVKPDDLPSAYMEPLESITKLKNF
jgi:hypothetical protein